MGSQGHSFLLELVNNEKSPLEYNDRHRALEELAKVENSAALVNDKLNHALDLLQATQSLTPCQHYSDALEVIAGDPDPWYLTRVEHAPVPEPKTDEELSAEEKADLPACDGLEDRRVAVIALLQRMAALAEGGTGGDEEADEPDAPAPKKRPPRKKKKKKKCSGKRC
jgi:hypothetical protein